MLMLQIGDLTPKCWQHVEMLAAESAAEMLGNVASCHFFLRRPAASTSAESMRPPEGSERCLKGAQWAIWGFGARFSADLVCSRAISGGRRGHVLVAAPKMLIDMLELRPPKCWNILEVDRSPKCLENMFNFFIEP